MLSHILQKNVFIRYADKQKPNDGRVLLYFCTSMEMSRIIA